MAYDSLKLAGQEEDYHKFASTEMMLYRITNSTATLCAGLALWLGFRKAYAVDIVFSLAAVLIACSLKEVQLGERQNNGNVFQDLINVIKESWKFLMTNKNAKRIMVVNALIGAISTLVLFFLQAKLPLAGLNHAMLGPALFVMGLGAAMGSRAVSHFPDSPYKKVVTAVSLCLLLALGMTFTKNPYLMIGGGFIGAFADDFLEVRTDVILNEMIPSEQRATLISVNSFVFSVIMIIMSTLLGWVMK